MGFFSFFFSNLFFEEPAYSKKFPTVRILLIISLRCHVSVSCICCKLVRCRSLVRFDIIFFIRELHWQCCILPLGNIGCLFYGDRLDLLIRSLVLKVDNRLWGSPGHFSQAHKIKISHNSKLVMAFFTRLKVYWWGKIVG